MQDVSANGVADIFDVRLLNLLFEIPNCLAK
jgi:hypothetical protein